MEDKIKKISEVPLLEQATEKTNLLVEHNGETCRIPASSLGQGETNENNSVVHCIVGSGYPISTGGVFVSPPISEKPAVGSLYLDVDHFCLLVCAAIDDVDTWVLLGGNSPEYASDGTLITFRIINPRYWDETIQVTPKTYLAISGMTWGEWCESEYNTDGFVASEEYVYANLEGMDILTFKYAPNQDQKLSC